jgi:hypothetical protein
MRNHFAIEQVVRDFRLRLSEVVAALEGDERTEAAHRAYEAALCKTPRLLVDEVHDRLAAAMAEHGMLSNRVAV